MAKAALHASEEHFREIFEHAPFGIVISTLGGMILEVNETLSAMLGFESQAEMVEAVDNQGANQAVFSIRLNARSWFNRCSPLRDGTSTKPN